MKNRQQYITIFEHESLRTDMGAKRLTDSQLAALQIYYGENGVPYYSLIHKGVKFCEFVGVIQIGKTTIEILPKADKKNDANSWRKMLIGMLHSVGIFNIHAPSSSNLKLKLNSILDLYFELFVIELEYLLYRGLVKKYRKVEGNTTSLKGSIKFAQHLNKNLIHQERFYVRYSSYDREHQLHAILYKTLKLLYKINTNSILSSRLGALLLDFPEIQDIKISESLFEGIQLDRKTEKYKNAIEISRLILLNYHPDVGRGMNDVLALMFDMNVLWEQFVYVSFRRFKPKETTITAQNIKSFWKPVSGYRSKIKPDIVLNKGRKNCIVLDTKWKNLNGHNPSPDDLRQMYVYMKFYAAQKVALIYPGINSNIKSGTYYKETSGELGSKECSLISIAVNQDIRIWQKQLCDQIVNWFEINNKNIQQTK